MALGMFGRAIAGGLAGGLMTGDLGGIAGGAAAAGLGGWAGGKMLANRGGVAGLARKGLGYGMQGARRGAAMGAKGYYGGMLGKRAGGALFSGSVAAGKGMGAASSWLGKNASEVNSVGAYAFGALGTAAGAHIGSSVLRSNRGY